jgi:hypothetical protein
MRIASPEPSRSRPRPTTQRRSSPVKGNVERLLELGTVGEEELVVGVVLVLDGADEVVLGLELSLEGAVPLAGAVLLEGAGLGGVL